MADPARGPFDGVLVVDKPQGPTSHDVVAAVRKWVRPSRTGHTGTLDPAATGVLPVCVGAATRLSRFLTRGPKAYAGRIVLGIATDTYDAEGTIVASNPAAGVSLADARRAAAALTGELMQTPPPWSAKRVAGRRSYALAREGKEEMLSPCPVHVDRFDLLELEGSSLTFEVECSSGTYVRSLAQDLGAALGCGAHLAELRRTRSGPFTVERASSLGTMEEAARRGALAELLLPLEEVDLGLETARLTPSGVRSALAGRRIALSEISSPAPGGPAQVRLVDPDGRLLGVAEPIAGQEGGLQPRLILSPALSSQHG